MSHIYSNYSISKLTTFQTIGNITHFEIFHTVDALVAFVKSRTPYALIGKGSNVVLAPQASMKVIQISDRILPEGLGQDGYWVNAGTSINSLLKQWVEKGISGLEFAAGIPASIGGMVAMNFGCWGQQISDKVKAIRLIDETGKEQTISSDNADFGYRRSIFQTQKWIIVQVLFSVKLDDPNQIDQCIQSTIQKRLKTQPIHAKTFGSIFRNPDQDFAARLIEAVGMKGFRYKNIAISDQHANFMVNLGSSTVDDVRELISLVQQKVQSKFNVLLQPEVKIIDACQP